MCACGGGIECKESRAAKMAERRPWSTKTKTKERSAKLVAVKRAQASAETCGAAVTASSSAHDTSNVASTSSLVSGLQHEVMIPSPLQSEDTSVVEDPGVGSETEYK